MPYDMEFPDGTIVENISDDLDPKEAKRRILQKYPELAGETEKPDTGFTGAAKAGYQRLKGDIAAVAGKTGLMDIEEAAKYQQEQEEKAQRMFKPTEEGWSEAPVQKFKETLGGSLPYMAAPVVAALGAAALPVTGPTATALGLGASALASGIQFTGSNLSRQIQEGKELKDTDLMAAGAAAIPQAALDTLSLKLIPGLGRIFGAAGKELPAEVLENIAKQGILKTTGAYALQTGKTAGIEGATEAAQQLLERLQAGLDIADEKARSEYFDSFIGGAVLGGTLAVPGTYVERVKQTKEYADAVAKAQETGEPQILQLPYDPNVQGTANYTPIIVNPDGSTQFPSERNQFAPQPTEEFTQAGLKEAYAPQARIPMERQVTEAFADEGDKARIEQARLEESRRLSPAMAKLNKLQEKADKLKESVSAFAKVDPINGLYLPAVEDVNKDLLEEIDFVNNYRSIAVQTDQGPKIYEGVLRNNGKQFVGINDDGKEVKFNTTTKKVVVDPTEKDIYRMEAGILERQAADASKAFEEAHKEAKAETKKFADFIKANKINYQYAPDVSADILRPKRKVPYRATQMFDKDGMGLDDIAVLAHERGFLSKEEFENPADRFGVNALISKLADLYDGNIVSTDKVNDIMGKMRDIDQSRMDIEKEIERRGEFLAQTPTEEQAAALEPVVPEEPTAEAIKYERKFEATEKFLADAEKLAKDLRNALDKMGLKEVGLNLQDVVYAIQNGKEVPVNGTYFRKLIEVSLSGDNIARTLNHEALHAMRELGFFSDADWKILSNMAEKEWINKYKVDTRYKDLSQEEQVEEAIADAFADMQTQPPKVKSIFSKMKDFFKRVANVLRGNGFKTAEDLLGKAAEGKLKPQEVAREVNVEKKAEVSPVLEGVDSSYADLLEKQFVNKKATFKDKVEALKPNFFNRIVQGLFDEFHAIKKYSEEAYMKSVLSKSTDGALEGLLFYGQVGLKDGALVIKQGTKGLVDILKPLGTEVDRYQMWKALNRDAQMPPEKRSFSDELVDGRNKLIEGKIDGKPRSEVYNTALREENALNKSVLEVAKQQGLIDEDAYKTFSKDIYYIPFYKYIEEEDSVMAVNASSKLSGQYFSKALKGGEKQVNDLMENVLRNWSHILSASMKNQAGVDTLKAAEKLGAAEKVKSTYEGKDAIKVMENGKVAYYAVTDPLLLDSVSLISYAGPKSPFLDIAKGFTNILRTGVTMSPAYKVRNLIRDTIQAASVSDLSLNVLNNVSRGLQLSDRNNPTFIAALAGGGVFEMGAAHEGDQAKLIKRLVDKGVDIGTILDTPEKIKGVLGKAFDWYNEQGNRFENANRLALYDKLMSEGKTHLQASFAARDLMNFSSQGSFRAIKIVSQVVPFFNARLQGLYKLGRDGITPTYRVLYNTATGKEITASDRKKALQFSVVTSAVMMASVMLYMAFKDDEDFQRREAWDRDNFWWFKINDTIFRIPKPFEIGAAGTLAERITEQISDDKVEGKVFFDRLRAIFADTFSMNPIPQAFKPMIDLYANKDSFTGAPIESAGLENLSKQERYTDSTSGIAKALGGTSELLAKVLSMNPEAQGFSPVQMDYAIKAYLGWIGSTSVAIADKAVQPWSDVEKPSKSMLDLIGVSSFVKQGPEVQSKYVTNFYDSSARMNQAFADMKRYAEQGEMAKAEEIYKEKGNLIALKSAYDAGSKQLASYRKYIQIVNNDKKMTKEDKENEIKRTKILMSNLTKQLEEVRISLKK